VDLTADFLRERLKQPAMALMETLTLTGTTTGRSSATNSEAAGRRRLTRTSAMAPFVGGGWIVEEK